MADKIRNYENFDNMSESEQLNEQEIRLSLNEEDFTTLVSGGILVKGNVKIILKDIGYDLMLSIIADLKSNL